MDNIKRDSAQKALILSKERDTYQEGLLKREQQLRNYQSAFEDLKQKNYQLENVAFTYHVTLQRLKEKEIEVVKKLEEAYKQNRHLE